uniref:GIY-YIG domain-containing protein n=1 Tax=Parascaris univalens TaxID=6257 RepID=A0A915B9E5_PARUN
MERTYIVVDRNAFANRFSIMCFKRNPINAKGYDLREKKLDNYNLSIIFLINIRNTTDKILKL